ncbi:hypothetical protein L249_3278 [Ophiocordyceps polyrhachis-furcata BCC 54312]|uniref:Glucan 1,3-beta-glucosidase n=1 Tax=Ophiocordyceps polyrhachis-furcata BCC 54312 TaxID=1330021 RepID=A0A367LPW3_9HYPO|nr:hypothetical protein L249_3278 [Ophiocordyceps polyrhachis-furcata BCC 54312]
MLLKSVLIASSLVTTSLALASPHDGHHHHDSHSKDDKSIGATTAPTTSEGTAQYPSVSSGASTPTPTPKKESNDDWSHKTVSDFEQEFTAAKSLAGTNGQFTSVRLFSCVKPETDDEMTPAFEAAVKTNTSILAGVWASGGKGIEGEMSALKKAIEKWGSKFTDLLIGVSVGSEDLYRSSEAGKKNKAGEGNSAEKIVDYIKAFRKAFEKSPIAKVPVGHVDVWKAWKDPSNKAVIEAVDWIGLDAYAYYDDDMDNYVTNASDLLDMAVAATEKAIKEATGSSRPIWLTEIGWPVSGPEWNKGVASVKNAKYFWDDIGCRRLFNKVPTFWYTLRDSNPQNEMKFAITEKGDLNKARFELGCPAGSDSGFDSDKAAATGAPDVDQQRAGASSAKIPGVMSCTVLAVVVGLCAAWV